MLTENRVRVMAALRKNGSALEYAAAKMRGNREMVLAAVGQKGRALECAAEELKGIREVVLAAVGQDGRALEYATEEMRGDREVVLAAVGQDGRALEYASSQLQVAHRLGVLTDNRVRVMAALRKNGSALEYAAKEMRGDRDVVLAAVGQHGRALEYAMEELRGDREVVLAAVGQNGSALEYAAEELRGNREVVMAAVGQDGRALEYAAEELRGDREVVLAAVVQNGSAAQFASSQLQEAHRLGVLTDDRMGLMAALRKNGSALEFASSQLQEAHRLGVLTENRVRVMAALRKNGSALEYAAAKMRGNREVVLAAVGQKGRALECAAEELKGIREVVLAAVGQDGRALEYAMEELRGDREVVLAAVGQDGRALEYASSQLQVAHRLGVLTDNRVRVMAALRKNGSALEYAAEEMRGDREVVLAAVGQHGRALEYAMEELRGDREVVLAAVGQNGSALEYAAEELRGNREVVMAAVGQDGRALEYAAEELRGDREVVLAAVGQNGSAVQFASSQLQVAHRLGVLTDDRVRVMAALRKNGRALEYAMEELRGDREVVLAAVGQNGSALEYAAEEMRGNREVVMAAVGQDGRALEYAAEELRGDREVVLAAVGQDGRALEYAAEEMRGDREVVLAAVGQNGCALEYAAEEMRRDREVVLAAVGQDGHLGLGAMLLGDPEAGSLVRSLAQAAEILQSLDLSGNALTTVPAGIGLLGALKRLNLCDNSITNLPIELLQLTNLTNLELEGNSMLQPVVEIGLVDGTRGIFEYLKDLYDDPQPSFSLKLLLAGPTMAGKSSLLRALLGKADRLTAVDERTIGLDIERVVLEDPRAPDGVSFLVYDAGGHDEYQEMHQPFVTQGTLYVLVWDISRPRPGDVAVTRDREMKDIVRLQVQWATLIQTCAPGSTVLLVGSHADEVDGLADLDERCQYVQEYIREELVRYEEVQRAEYERLAAAQTTSSEAQARFRQLAGVLEQPLCIAGCITVSAKTLYGIPALRSKLLELAFDQTKFPSFEAVQPGTYVKLHRYLKRSFPDSLSVTWGHELKNWAMHMPDLTAEKFHILCGGLRLVHLERARSFQLARSSALARYKFRAFREYKFRVDILDETAVEFTVRYSHAKSAHAQLKKTYAHWWEREGLDQQIQFPSSWVDTSLYDMTFDEANAIRRAEELRLYYQQLFGRHDVLRLYRAPCADIASLHGRYLEPFRKVQADPDLMRRAMLYLRIVGEVLWHDVPLLSERVFLKPQLLVNVMKELVRHDLGDVVRNIRVTDSLGQVADERARLRNDGLTFVETGELRGPRDSPFLQWLWRNLQPPVKHDPAQMEFLIELLAQHGLLTRLKNPPRWLLPMRLPQIATLQLPRTLSGVVTTNVRHRRYTQRLHTEPEPESEAAAYDGAEREAGVNIARVAASVEATSNMAGAAGAALIALGKAGTVMLTTAIAAAVAPAILSSGMVVAGGATVAAVASAVVGHQALKTAQSRDVDIPDGIRNSDPILYCTARHDELTCRLHDLGLESVGLDPHGGLIYKHCIVFSVWKPGQYSFADESDAKYSKVCRTKGEFKIPFNSLDPTVRRISSNADPALLQQINRIPISTVTSSGHADGVEAECHDDDDSDDDDGGSGDEVARLHEFHQPLPSGMVAVMISRCAKACGPDTEVWRQAIRTRTDAYELLVCLDGASRWVIWARCKAGGRHQMLLERVAAFERIVQSVVAEQWPGCSSTVSCFAPSATTPVVVPLSTCELALARAETALVVNGVTVPLATMVSGSPPPMPLKLSGQLAALRFFRDVAAAVDGLLDLPDVAAFTAAIDTELVARLAGRPWSELISDADVNGVLSASSLLRQRRKDFGDSASPALSLMAALGELYDNCHLLCHPIGGLPSLEAVGEHLLGHFEWLEESVHTHAAAFKLAQLPALEAAEVFQRPGPEPEAEPFEFAPVERLKRYGGN
eukprot:SAG11_NODE_11_length_27870_cov_16.327428_3_plen_1940_part_00